MRHPRTCVASRPSVSGSEILFRRLGRASSVALIAVAALIGLAAGEAEPATDGAAHSLAGETDLAHPLDPGWSCPVPPGLPGCRGVRFHPHEFGPAGPRSLLSGDRSLWERDDLARTSPGGREGGEAGPVGSSRLSRATEFWQALSNAVSSDHVKRDLDYLSTYLRTRYYSTAQMDSACRYVYEEFESLGLMTTYDPFTYHGYALKNVLGVKAGSVDPSRIYVIVGHLDSVSQNPQNEAPGADDNGSGSCAVLEAARLLAGRPSDYTIYFLCVSAEEQGLVGSEHFAAQADAQNLDIRAVLNLDMVGWNDPAGADLWLEGFHNGVSSVWLMDLVGENGEAYAGLSVYQYPGEGFGSDHVPFHNHGYPAILSIENEWDDYPCYHRTCDEADQIDREFWRKITAANVVSLAQLAQVGGELGGISGTVSVDWGDPAEVRLVLAGTAFGERWSDPQGDFDWTGIFPGRYRLIAEKSAFAPESLEVVIADGEVVHVNLHLRHTNLPVPIELPESGPYAGLPDLAAGPRISAWPNPMQGATMIALDLPEGARGAITIHRTDGRQVARVVSPVDLRSGSYRWRWNGRDEAGHTLESGLYWIRWSGVRPARSSLLLIR